MTEDYEKGFQTGRDARETTTAEERSQFVQTDTIIGVCCGYFKMDVRELKSQQRYREIVYPRHICMYFLRKYSNMTSKEIGRIFGGRDHSTALYGARHIADLQQFDDQVRRDVSVIKRAIDSILFAPQQANQEPAY